MTRERLRITVRGAVQGIGFRPFVYRLAREMRLCGWVRNEGPSVVLEAEGRELGSFLERLRAEPPAGARIDGIDARRLPVRGDSALEIVPSRRRTAPPSIVPDRVTCDACLTEVLDPASRFFGYPFTNCSQCGPRYSIVDRLPYDRRNTAMAGFPMCAACRAEYEDPTDRRFHAQPTACPTCGPTLIERSSDGRPGRRGAAALEHAVERLGAGALVALKGVGGYQLLADATSAAAVATLRARKHRAHKPLAVLVVDLAAARELADVSGAEAELLRSPAGPIVLLRSENGIVAEAVHPHQAEIGILLPTTALHWIVAAEFGRPLICTSGNLHEEPICIDDDEAIERLGSMADVFLSHDRPIRRAVDDSVARVVGGAPQVLRLGRGYAPFVLPDHGGQPALAMGGQWKNALAVRDEERIVVGPHIGDLTNTHALDAMRRQVTTLGEFFDVAPSRVACDRHPDYASTVHGEQLGLPVVEVQHHVAHALSVMLEHGCRGPALAIVWDGAGLGTDGTIWGGEFLRVDSSADEISWERVAHLRPFRLPGGDSAARHPRRSLAGLRFESRDSHERVPEPYRSLLEARINAPICTSAGRLFDGIAALLGHDDEQTYEGMAPSLLERDAARAVETLELEAVALRPGQPIVLDWSPTVRSIEEALAAGAPREPLSAAFHGVLADAMTEVARMVGESTVLLTGGCFQNRVLTEEALRKLEGAGFDVLLSRRLPPNDGGLAAGQLVALRDGAPWRRA